MVLRVINDSVAENSEDIIQLLWYIYVYANAQTTQCTWNLPRVFRVDQVDRPRKPRVRFFTLQRHIAGFSKTLHWDRSGRYVFHQVWPYTPVQPTQYRRLMFQRAHRRIQYRY